MTSAFLYDRSDRQRMTFSGDKAKEALGGLVTNDVVALRPGEGQRAAALTVKGRVIALLRVFDRGDDLLVDCDAAAGEGFAAMIRKFVNPRLAKYAVVTADTGCLAVHGDAAAAIVARVLGAHATSAPASGDQPIEASAIDPSAIESLAVLSGLRVGADDDAVWLVRSTDLSVAGFELFASRARIAALRLALESSGVRTAPAEEITVHRVEAGLPQWGVEMDGETIPQEAVLDDLGAISFNKGCYTGQEVVARIHFRGHVNRHLRWLLSERPLAVGARVLDESGNDVGDVRSSVVSPARGALAIAMIRREVEPGATVAVRDGETTAAARVERIAAA